MLADFDLYKDCIKYSDLPILIVGETMANIYGWVSVCNHYQYYGPEKYKEHGLNCLLDVNGISGYENSRFFKGVGNMKFASQTETIMSLIEHRESKWTYKCLSQVIRFFDRDLWVHELKSRGLEEKLRNMVEEIIRYDEDDQSLRKVLEWRITGVFQASEKLRRLMPKS
ncbi:MAG: hypothetical protein LBT59_27925 [Clostridiales bacterium]|jgi:hypothetical protein|nr:hypothetical protein [Clostridiales bacterium]